MSASDIFDTLGEAARERLRKKRQPEWTSPMLAVLSDDVFSSPDWIYEPKLDGIRCLVFREGGDARIVSRNRNDLTSRYPELVEALERDPRSHFVADGEIVAFDGDVTSFARLQGRSGIRDPDEARASGIDVFLYLFDLLHVAGHDTTKVALRDRKRLLKRALAFEDPIRYTTHRNRDGEAYHREACRRGWEGVIAKRADGEYVHSRSKDWLKFKCVNRQELVVGGYTEPKGSRKGLGALLVGYYEDEAFVYAGRVGTGFDDETLESLAGKLGGIERKTSPFDSGDPDTGGVHWARPELVVEVGFTEWTEDGRLRHPRYLGQREDKEPREVVRERASSGG